MPTPGDHPATFEGLCDYLTECKVGRHFRESNLIYHKNRAWNGARHIVPPHEFWPNMVPTLHLADLIRAAHGGPITILCGYRCDAYNDLIKSESDNHPRFGALDLQVGLGKRRAFARLTQRIVGAHRDHGFYVGLGLYPAFVHIDVNLYARQRNWGTLR